MINKLEELEEIGQKVLDMLAKYDLTINEMFYTLGYVERNLNMDMVEGLLEEYGLISFENEEQN